MNEWYYIGTAVGFFLIAALYASAGFGGGSSYLAVLAMLPLSFTVIRSTALICNIVVVSGSLLAFLRAAELSRSLLRKIVPLVLASIPMAFLAGNYTITERHFFIVLGITLVASSSAMFLSTRSKKEEVRKQHRPFFVKNLAIGGALGGLAGLVGIGGGIFLSPYLHLSGWETARRISITTAFFIFVNSFSGIAGQVISSTFEIDAQLLIPLALAVMAGGWVGVRFNIRKFSNKSIRRVTAIVILLAGCNVLRKYWLP